MTDKIVVLVTCGSAKEAAQIADALVRARVAACVNILELPVRSVYRWKGSVESAKEILLVIKSSRKQFPQLQRMVKSLHGYQVPEIIALPIQSGSREYLAWLGESVAPPRAAKKKKH